MGKHEITLDKERMKESETRKHIDNTIGMMKKILERTGQPVPSEDAMRQKVVGIAERDKQRGKI